jgi:mannose-6-phosphate isomerase-like protein (cupin superfamily)|tara:strand:- start:516 stop:875 length:360 start_codon:yes stop_codon:yes gene_type:complete
VRRQSELSLRDLKATTVRPAGAEGLAQACGAFDEPRFVAGVVSLPPGAMKDEEGVQTCSQVFIIRQGQLSSVEFTVNKEIFLLGGGDYFFVPPHNTYALRNHSKTVTAEISFVVMRPGS